MRAGLGFGGSCLPKDSASLVHQAHKAGCDTAVVEAARAVNEGRPSALMRRLDGLLGGLVGRRVALLGLAFKGGTDDIRESRGTEIARLLLDQGVALAAYDPAAMGRAKEALPGLTYCESAYHAASGAQAVVIAADWDEFRRLDLAQLCALMKRPLLVDGCNLYSLDDAARAGIEYHSIGRRSVAPTAAHARARRPVPMFDEAWEPALTPPGA